MRIADKMAFNQVNNSISKNRSEMSSLQNQAATQKRVTKPSDDPVAASRVLFSRVEQRGNEQFIKNLNYAKGFLDFSEQSLNELTEVIVRAKELAISQANDASASAQSRRIVAEEIKQLHNQSVSIANRKLGERFIFAGFKTTDMPFDADGEYKGDQGEMKIHVDKGTFLSMNLPGSVVFQGKGLSKDGFNYKSLQQPRNVQELAEQKAENPKSFKVGEEVDARGRQSEQSGQAGNTSTPPEVVQRGPASLRSTENVAPSAAASASPSSSQKVAADRDDETSQTKDGVNIFHAIKKLEIALVTDDKFGIQESLDRLDDTLQQIVVARTSLGSRVMTIDNTLNSMYTSNVDTKATISQLEDVDAFEVISDINKTESALQATLQTSGKLIQKSLMDFVS